MIIAPSPLRDSAMARMWDDVLARCKTHPHEAGIRGSLQEIALHWVCYHRAPLDVWREVIRCSKPALRMKGSCGRTPLHISCANGSTTAMMQLLVQADARVTLLEGNAVDKTPIAMLWNCHLPHLNRKQSAALSSSTNSCGLSLCMTTQERVETLSVVGDVWDKMSLLIRAAHHGEGGVSSVQVMTAASIDEAAHQTKRLKIAYDEDVHAVSSDEEGSADEKKPAARCKSDSLVAAEVDEKMSYDEDLMLMPNDKPFRVVHSAIFLGSECPDSFLRLAISLHPEQAAMKMEHYTPKDCKARKLVLPWMTHRLLAYVDVDGLPLHVAAGHRCPMSAESLRRLIAAYPRAAKTLNKKKQLPLHIALQRGRKWNDGLQDLAEAAPEALTTRDLNHHMYPFMLASVGKNHNLDAAFGLLKAADPSVVLAQVLNAAK